MRFPPVAHEHHDEICLIPERARPAAGSRSPSFTASIQVLHPPSPYSPSKKRSGFAKKSNCCILCLILSLTSGICPGALMLPRFKAPASGPQKPLRLSRTRPNSWQWGIVALLSRRSSEGSTWDGPVFYALNTVLIPSQSLPSSKIGKLA